MKSIAWKTLTRTGTLLAAVLFASTGVRSEDIDIFTLSGTGGTTNQPNVMILVDNSSNWARSSQQWPDNSGKQGQAELQAIYNVINSINPLRANLGFAGFTGSGSSAGGYIRFGLRDMTVATNKTAYLGVLNHIKADINASAEKVNDNAEAAAMYEVMKYYKSQSVFRGRYVSGNDPASNVDAGGNAGNPSNGTNRPTASAQGLTSGFALTSTGSTTYTGPDLGSCGRHHLIMVINNAQGSVPSGSQTYESTSAGNVVSGGSSSSWTEEWARTLYQSGITVYILDAYNAQQNATHSRVLALAAAVGGGRYYAVKNQSQIEFAIREILAEINAINSTFATASLPISATNRSQNLNQVFIGMFRPDANAKPRWRGNLKQYQLIGETSIDLGDALGVNAVNPQTGFIASCAVSRWTTDSGNWWETTYENAGAQSACTSFPTVDGTIGSMWSDSPDGPSVEKGGVAEVLRKGNNPPSTNTSPTWTANRNVYTYSSSATTGMEEITTTNMGWSSTLLDWVKGHDDAQGVTADSVTTYPYSEFTTTSTSTRTRPSIHGDVIHSRPLPVNYGGTTGVTVYYGSNDGMFRAVDASTGKERWAFIAPEHKTDFQRLHDNSPLLPYATVSSTLSPEAKDYFFDGSMGIYQKSDNSKIWIYSTMRRGGRMIYAFDVTNPAAPSLKWRVGCPNQSDNVGCTTGFEQLGQTWSVPAVAFLKGWSSTTPVVIIGGGYDTCEDTNSATTGCDESTRKGRGVYVINGDTGARLAHLVPTGGTGSVAADLALADADSDGSVDYAYAATTTGELWRVDFSNTSFGEQNISGWGVRKVAYTAGAGRKFLYPPALFRAGSKMYAAIGSGDREHPISTHYPYTASIANRLYVLLDDLSVAHSSTNAAVNLDDPTAMQNFSAETTCDTPGVTPSSTYRGWFMGLTGRGEQTVTSALIASGMVTFNTNMATPSTSVNQCTNPLGEARGYWVNLLNASGAIGVGNSSCGGSRSTTFVGGGLTPSPTLATVQVGDRVVTVVIGAAQKSGGASSGIAPQRITPAIASKRKTIYWKSNTSE